MACSDCSECNKRYECIQEEHYNCPFNQVKENIQYIEVLKTIKTKLTDCLRLIEENRNHEDDLEDYESDITTILEKIKQETTEEIINEYNKLFN